MKSKISSLALISLFLSNAFGGEEDPFLVNRHDGETVSAASVVYNVRLSKNETLRKSAVGIDDTLNTFNADVTPLVAGRSFASGPAFAQSRVEITDNGDGVREIRIIHKGRAAMKAPANSVETDTVNASFSSYNQVSFAPYRVSGNIAGVPLNITCEVSDGILHDPPASQSSVDLALFASHHLTRLSDNTNISSGGGQIELETAYSNDPGFIFDFGTNGTSTDLGNGRVRVNSSYSRTVVTGYLGKLDFVNHHAGAFICGGLDGNDTAPWEINSGAGVTFTISSADPHVRFAIYTKENPAPAPDLQIGRTSQKFKGAEIQQSAPSSAQKAKIKQGSKRKKTFYLRLVNHGPDASGGSGDSAINLKGPRRKKSLKFTYFQSTGTGFKNVTGAIASGRYLLPGHFESFGEDFKVVSKRGRKRSGGGRQTTNKVSLVSQNPAAGGRDMVQALIMTK